MLPKNGRLNTLLFCFTGCVIAALLGLILLLKFDNELLAILSAAVFPTDGCYLSGIKGHRQLGKIALYAGIGWTLGYALQPAVAQTSASHIQRILKLPLLGYDWHVHGSVVSTLLSMVGAYFGHKELSDSNGLGKSDVQSDNMLEDC